MEQNFTFFVSVLYNLWNGVTVSRLVNHSVLNLKTVIKVPDDIIMKGDTEYVIFDKHIPSYSFHLKMRE